MNLILLSDDDFLNPTKARLTGRHFEHVTNILKAKVGQELTVGKINGLMGTGKILEINSASLDIQVKLNQRSPAALALTLIMALPRPPMLRRTLQCVTSLGVKKIIILNFSKVEKSLWQSSALKPEAIREDLVLGLEQAKDTVLPEVRLEKGFKPFVDDKLSDLIKGKNAYLAHPGEKKALSKAGKKPTVLILGPEGGLVDFEVDLLKSKGVQGVNLGERILRFENAVNYAIGRMFFLMILLMSVSVVRAEELPCQDDFYHKKYYEQSLAEAKDLPVDELEYLKIQVEARQTGLKECLEQYEKQYGTPAKDELLVKLAEVVAKIMNGF